MTKKQRALEVIARLKEEYPDAGCTLDYDQAWKLLVSVRLAAQCTDERVNRIVEVLYEKYPTVDALADADVMLFDEPLKGMDERPARRVNDFLRPLLAGRTVLWVTHDEREVALLDRPLLWTVREGGVRGPHM